MNKRQVVVIGSGPAGLTAAMYLGRAGLEPLVIAGLEAGGQLMQTTEVENYPGFPTIMGPELMTKMTEHAQKFGAEILRKDATKVDFNSKPFKVWTDSDEYEAESVIVATGASAKWLGIESETRLKGRGVSSCATCDGFFFKEKDIVVVGGGDTALEEATFLTRFAKTVKIIHRRDELRANKQLQKRAEDNPKIEFIWNSEIEEILGENKVEGVKIKNNQTGESSTLDIEGVFVAIGHTPNTKLFDGQLDLDEQGYIKPAKGKTHTNIEGVFVAGDVEDFEYRQAITAAGSGCMAALDLERYLSTKGN